MGTLHLVATPIGNLEDVTLRALRVLGEADLLLAEDTRHSRVLLERHGIRGRPVSLHAHNEASRTREVLQALAEGRRVALISDAGTPLVSDPGERLVAAAIAAGHRVVPVPGASAVLAALVASGLPALPFHCVGFLPRRSGERRALLERLAALPATLVFFESPRRLPATLATLAEALGGERQACVARELSKLHEELRRGSLSELVAHFQEGTRGEVTIVVAGAGEEPALSGAELDRAIREGLAEGDTPRSLAADLAPLARRPRREIYARALQLRDEPPSGPGG